ncbi:MAG: hypothetical protein PHQ80_02610 [Candidatus ainarchaeum sp.]|nr:hypothetical protein [Candidatus ainarchaeum sp.]MDD5096676.1 hypothetical protein [Candidatus ainarchaeum sp.]
MDMQKTRPWRALVFISLVGLVAIVFAELFFLDIAVQYLTKVQMEYLSLAFTMMLLLDIYISFLKASDKVAFLKKNSLKILVLLPWGTIFRALSFLKLESAFAEIPLISDLFAMEKAGAVAKTVMIAEKARKISEL